MKKITFIHAADLHLDSPMLGLKQLPEPIINRMQESTFLAFRKVIDAAVKYQVDFVILAGDLFDQADRSIRAQARLRKELERLKECAIAAYIIHGNHDHLEGNWRHIHLPENVYIFGPEVEVKAYTKKGVTANLYGFSYGQRHVYERMIDQFEKREGADFHIGILHGHHEGSSEHGRYAPFQLKDLLEKDFDYWALGHIHKRELLNMSPPIVYPGNIQGRHRKETGMKGCYLVDLTSAGADLHWVETSDIVWKEMSIITDHVMDFDQLYQLCLSLIEEERATGLGTIITLTLEETRAEEWLDQTVMEELLESLQEMEQAEESFVWIRQITLKRPKSSYMQQMDLTEQGGFFNELFQLVEEDQQALVEKSIVALKQNPLGRRYMDKLTEVEEEELLQESLEMLMHQLLTNK
jgi:DNA repair exonuclease SbcCD nuclease subunit